MFIAMLLFVDLLIIFAGILAFLFFSQREKIMRFYNENRTFSQFFYNLTGAAENERRISELVCGLERLRGRCESYETIFRDVLDIRDLDTFKMGRTTSTIDTKCLERIIDGGGETGGGGGGGVTAKKIDKTEELIEKKREEFRRAKDQYMKASEQML
jgi:hypothetical protein